MLDKKILGTFVGIVMASQFGCTEMSVDGHRETVSSGLSAVPQAVQIESLFGSGSADHFISHFSESFGTGPKKWNTEVHFGGRYSLTMQVDVEVDHSKNRIVKVIGEPLFLLGEHKKIVPLTDNRFQSFTGDSLVFGPKEWKVFFDSKGDFSTLGLNQNTDAVKFFKEYASSIRRPRESISLTKLQADQETGTPDENSSGE